MVNLDFCEAVGGVVLNGSQAVTGEVAVGVQAVGDLAVDGGGDGVALRIGALGDEALGEACEFVAGGSYCQGLAGGLDRKSVV